MLALLADNSAVPVKGILITLIVIAVIAAIGAGLYYSPRFWVQIPSGWVGVEFRFKKYVTTRGEGLQIFVPIAVTITPVDMRTQTRQLAQQQMVTQDGVTVTFTAVIFFKVFDAHLRLTAVTDLDAALNGLVQGALRTAGGSATLRGVLAHDEAIVTSIQARLDTVTVQWGANVTKVELNDIAMPPEMERSMASLAEATLRSQAMVVGARGELDAAQSRAQAAEIMRAGGPEAMRLAEFEMLRDIGADQNTVIVVSSGADGGISAQIAAAAAAGVATAKPAPRRRGAAADPAALPPPPPTS